MPLLKILQEFRTPFLDRFFLLATNFGDEFFCIALICGLFWCIDKRLAYKIGFAFFVSGLFVQALKIGVRADRPWIRDSSLSPVEGAKRRATGYSFPSGHTQISSALFASLFFHARKGFLSALSAAAVLLVGFSRLYLGVHTPADVAFSMLLTVLLSAGIALFFERFYAEKCVFKVSLVMFLLSVSLAVFSIFLLKSGAIDRIYTADCLKASGAGMGFAAGYCAERKWIRFERRTSRISARLFQYAAGMLLLFAIRSAAARILGDRLAAQGARYFLMTIFAVAIYPAMLQRRFGGSARKKPTDNPV